MSKQHHNHKCKEIKCSKKDNKCTPAKHPEKSCNRGGLVKMKTNGPSDAVLITSESQFDSQIALQGINIPLDIGTAYVLQNQEGTEMLGMSKVGWHSGAENFATRNMNINKGFGPSLQGHYEYSPSGDNSFFYYVFPGAEDGISLYQAYSNFNPTLFGQGQVYSNSGFFLGSSENAKEIQMLDTYLYPTYPDGSSSAIYAQATPLVEASRPAARDQQLNPESQDPCAFNVYKFNKTDFVFEAEVRKNVSCELIRPASITSFLNGVLVHDKYLLIGNVTYQTPPVINFDYGYEDNDDMYLQQHGDLTDLRLKSIWLRDRKRTLKLPAESLDLLISNRQSQYDYHKTSLITVPPSDYGDEPQFSDNVLYSQPFGQGDFTYPAQLDNPNRVVANNFEETPSDAIGLLNGYGSRFTLNGSTLTSNDKFESYQLHALLQFIPSDDAFLILSPTMKLQLSATYGPDCTPFGTVYFGDGSFVKPEVLVDNDPTFYVAGTQIEIVYHSNNYKGCSAHMPNNKLHWWTPDYSPLNACLEEVFVMYTGIVIHNWTSHKTDSPKANNIIFTNTALYNVWIRPLDNFGFVFTDVPVVTNNVLKASVSLNKDAPSGWTWQYQIVTQSFFPIDYSGSIAATVPITGYQDPTAISNGSSAGIYGKNLTISIPDYDPTIQYRIYATLLNASKQPISRLIYNTFGARLDRIYEQGLPYANINAEVDMYGVKDAELYAANSVKVPPCWPGYVGPNVETQNAKLGKTIDISEKARSEAKKRIHRVGK